MSSRASLAIEHVVVDIDETLTGDKPGVAQLHPRHLNGNVLFDILRDCAVENGVSPETASALLLDCIRQHVFWDYSDLIEALALPSEPTWARLADWHDRNLRAFDDGVQMVRRLHAAGFPLSISSNNPLAGCLLKLRSAGLADLASSPYFEQIFGSNVLMGQKNAPHWWPDLQKALGVPPERILVVGDNPKDDMQMPRAAGFRHFVLVDRSQDDPCRFEDGVHYVRRLDIVPEILKFVTKKTGIDSQGLPGV